MKSQMVGDRSFLGRRHPHLDSGLNPPLSKVNPWRKRQSLYRRHTRPGTLNLVGSVLLHCLHLDSDAVECLPRGVEDPSGWLRRHVRSVLCPIGIYRNGIHSQCIDLIRIMATR